MNKIKLLVMLPMIALMNLFGFTKIAELLRMPSDTAVIVGALMALLLVVADYVLYLLLFKKVKV